MVQTVAQNRTLDAAVLKGKKIAVVISRFNEQVCERMLFGAFDVLDGAQIPRDVVEVFHVPGAFEIPLVAKKAAASRRFAGIIALGCVIRGETPHFEFVSLAATMGCLNAGLETGCPVVFGVITVNDQAQADARSRPDEFNKGREAALALFDVLTTMERI